MILTLPDSPPRAPAKPVLAVKPLHIGPLLVDPPILQAPMAGFTNYVYRSIVREFGGVGLQATEMISAEGFVRLTAGLKSTVERLWGVKDEARPLAVQMWDNDPELLAECGKKLAFDYGVSVVDLNFGCPVRKISERAHSGSYLLRDPLKVGMIVSRVVKACAPVPVTAKIRLGCTHDCITAKEVARVIEDSGAAALTVHGRVAADFFKGNANWDRIAEIKTVLKSMPLIGNGDIDTPEKVAAAFWKYNVDGVMIARAALGKPWLFKQAAALLRGEEPIPEPSLLEQRDLLLRHQRLVVKRFGEERGNVLMRRYACCYAQGRRGAREFRSLISKCDTTGHFVQIVNDKFPMEHAEKVEWD
ncbi:MAG TPA: tRNA-dihydrouridine synthase [Planctomycetota bacterium]|nr:tRNA-dihydrouridine synthase [Planctomycetota bacterium]